MKYSIIGALYGTDMIKKASLEKGTTKNIMSTNSK
jgi:hypothetical protein